MIREPQSIEPYLRANKNEEPASTNAGAPLIEINSRTDDEGSISYDGFFRKCDTDINSATNSANIAKLAAATHFSTATVILDLLQ